MSARPIVSRRHGAHTLLPRLAGLLALAAVAAACGSDDVTKASPASPLAPADVTSDLGGIPTTLLPPTTMPSPSSSGQRWTYTSTGSDGDVTAIELQISKPSPVPAAPRAGTHSFSEVSCAADPQRDAVMAGSLKGTNKSPGGFSQVIDVQLYAGTADGTTGAVFDAALLFSNSTSCVSVGFCCLSTNSPIGVKSNDSLPPGGFVSVDFYIILHDVFTPVKPSGSYPVQGVYLLPYGGAISDITGPSAANPANAPNSSVGFPLNAVLG